MSTRTKPGYDVFIETAAISCATRAQERLKDPRNNIGDIGVARDIVVRELVEKSSWTRTPDEAVKVLQNHHGHIDKTHGYLSQVSDGDIDQTLIDLAREVLTADISAKMDENNPGIFDRVRR